MGESEEFRKKGSQSNRCTSPKSADAYWPCRLKHRQICKCKVSPAPTPVILCFSPTWKPILFCAVPHFTSGWFESGEGGFNGRPYNRGLPHLRLEKAIEGGMTYIDFSYTLPIALLYRCEFFFCVVFNRYTNFGESKRKKKVIKIWLLFIYRCIILSFWEID